MCLVFPVSDVPERQKSFRVVFLTPSSCRAVKRLSLGNAGVGTKELTCSLLSNDHRWRKTGGIGYESACQAKPSIGLYLVEIRHRVVRGGRKCKVNVGELQEKARR